MSTITDICRASGWISRDCLSAALFTTPKPVSLASLNTSCADENVNEACRNDASPKIARDNVSPDTAVLSTDDLRNGKTVTWKAANTVLSNCAGTKEGLRLECQVDLYKDATGNGTEKATYTFTPDAEGNLIPKIKFTKEPAGPIVCDLHYKNPDSPDKTYPPKKKAFTLHTPSVLKSICSSPVKIISQPEKSPLKQVYLLADAVTLKHQATHIIICDPFQGWQTYASNPTVKSSVTVDFLSHLTNSWQKATLNGSYYEYKQDKFNTFSGFNGGYVEYTMRVKYQNYNPAYNTSGLSVRGKTCSGKLTDALRHETSPMLHNIPIYDNRQYTFTRYYYRDLDYGPLNFDKTTSETNIKKHLWNYSISYTSTTMGGLLEIKGYIKDTSNGGTIETWFYDNCADPASGAAANKLPSSFTIPLAYSTALKLSDKSDPKIGETVVWDFVSDPPQNVKFYHKIFQVIDATQTSLVSDTSSAPVNKPPFAYSPTTTGLHKIYTYVISGQGNHIPLTTLTFTAHSKSSK